MKSNPAIRARMRWECLVEQWSNSSKSAQSWCKENKVPYTSFITWRKKIRSSPPAQNSIKNVSQNPFIEIVDQPIVEAGIEINVNGMVVKLLNQFDPTTLSVCLKVLKSLPC